MVVEVLSKVDSEGGVSGNPTASAASASVSSGINPVSKLGLCGTPGEP